MGLYHTWPVSPPGQTDFCNDTPEGHPNCWTLGNPPCDNWANISNNVMDYNEGFPAPAVTPCQIDRAHSTQFLGGTLSNYVNTCSNCIPANAFFTLDQQPSSDCILAQVYMEGTGSFNETQYKLEIYEVPFYGSTTIIPGTLLQLSFIGTIGKFNLSSFYGFQLGKTYRIMLEVKNSCSGWDSQVEYMYAYDPAGCSPLALSTEGIGSFQVSPNPSSGQANISLIMSEPQKLSLFLYDRYGNLIARVWEERPFSAGVYQEKWNGNHLKNGLYIWVLQNEKHRFTQLWSINKLSSNH